MMQVTLLPLAFLMSFEGTLDFGGIGLPSELTSQPGQRRLELQAPTFEGSPTSLHTHQHLGITLQGKLYTIQQASPRPNV